MREGSAHTSQLGRAKFVSILNIYIDHYTAFHQPETPVTVCTTISGTPALANQAIGSDDTIAPPFFSPHRLSNNQGTIHVRPYDGIC